MNAIDIREIVLKMNDQDVRQKAENLEKRLKNALRIKSDLEKKGSQNFCVFAYCIKSPFVKILYPRPLVFELKKRA